MRDFGYAFGAALFILLQTARKGFQQLFQSTNRRGFRIDHLWYVQQAAILLLANLPC